MSPSSFSVVLVILPLGLEGTFCPSLRKCTSFLLPSPASNASPTVTWLETPRKPFPFPLFPTARTFLLSVSLFTLFPTSYGSKIAGSHAPIFSVVLKSSSEIASPFTAFDGQIFSVT